MALSTEVAPQTPAALLTPSQAEPVSINVLQRIEQETLLQGREWTRLRLQERLQREVDRMGPVSPHSGLKLKRARRIPMTVRTVCGTVELTVWYGHCRQSQRNLTPVREVWRIAPHQQLSPELELRLAYTATETGSFEKAARMAGTWGCALSDDAIHACVGRKGRQALENPLTDLRPTPHNPFTLIIMMDGWLARHRHSQWGAKPPEKKADRVQWHEIKSAIIFRLEDRGQTASGRRYLIHKQAVATPANTEPTDFAQQVHREAMRMGLATATKVYVVQDGAVYLWNIFEDRFAQTADGVLDFYHASEHLWALAHELFGDGSAEAKRWAHTLLHQLRHGKEDRVIRTLETLMTNPSNHAHATETITTTAKYFIAHKDHIHYAALADQGIPIGSGAMESQCNQLQNRFKRRGQFWTQPGFAPLLAIALRSQNDELQSLWAA
jgi:hypothetical protein